MGDEYQNRRDIDKIYDDLYDTSRSLNAVTFGKNSKYRDITSDTKATNDGTIDAIIEYFGLESLNQKFESVIDRIYPIGTVYHTTDSEFNPNDNFVGVWVLIEDTNYEWERISETE